MGDTGPGSSARVAARRADRRRESCDSEERQAPRRAVDVARAGPQRMTRRPSRRPAERDGPQVAVVAARCRDEQRRDRPRPCSTPTGRTPPGIRCRRPAGGHDRELAGVRGSASASARARGHGPNGTNRNRGPLRVAGRPSSRRSPARSTGCRASAEPPPARPARRPASSRCCGRGPSRSAAI